MADIALVNAGRVEVIQSDKQHTWVAGEDITAGAPITQNATGKAINSDGNGAGVIATVRAIATRTVKSGESVTGIQKGRIGGYNFDSQAYGAKIWVSDTAATLGDVTGTTGLPVGSVEAATGNLPTAVHDKILNVDIPQF